MPGARSAARSLGVGTPLAARGTRSCVPFSEAPAAVACSRSSARPLGPRRGADSGSGAERIAAISGRGTGGGAQIPPRSLARTALVIHVTVEHPPLVGLGDQVLGLVVVAVGGLHGPQVYGDAVLLGGHHARQQVAVAGDEHDVGAGAVAGQLGELGVHGGVHALLGPAAVAAGQGAEPDGDPGHHAQPAVLGLRDAVGGAVEPVDAQQGPLRVGLGAVAQALDEGGVVDGDTGTGGLPGEETGGGAQQIPGVHQDDAAVHAIHPLSGRFCFGLPSSLPDHARVNGPNSIFGVAFRGIAARDMPCHTR